MAEGKVKRLHKSRRTFLQPTTIVSPRACMVNSKQVAISTTILRMTEKTWEIIISRPSWVRLLQDRTSRSTNPVAWFEKQYRFCFLLQFLLVARRVMWMSPMACRRVSQVTTRQGELVKMNISQHEELFLFRCGRYLIITISFVYTVLNIKTPNA